MKKKIIAVLIAIVFVVGTCFAVENHVKSHDEKLNEAVSKALLSATDTYLKVECPAEGHIILGTKDVTEKEIKVIKVYALTMVGNYGFENDNFIKVSGSGMIPMVFTFEKNNNNYILKNSEQPLDGACFGESIKDMFPIIYYPKVFGYSERDINELRKQERKYAEEYLKKIGRKAKIGDYVEHKFLTDVGVSEDVSNDMMDYEALGYPMHIGTCEQIENGIRYVYEQEYDKSVNEIRLKKYNYETKETVELIRVDALTGKEIK